MKQVRNYSRRAWAHRLYRPEAVKLILSDLAGRREPINGNLRHLDEAAGWILRAQDATPDDGVSGGYSFEDGWIASYAETTGYIIPTMLAYARHSRQEVLRDRSLAMADWVLKVQLPCGGFPGHFADDDHPPTVFNTGQVVFGLMAAFKETQEERFLTAAQRAAKWLVETQDPDGAWRRFDYRGTTHSYNTRTAWAMIEYALVTEDRAVLDAGTRNLEWARDQQVETGWFRSAGFGPLEEPFLHNIAYIIQGLLEAGWRTHHADAVEAGMRASRVLLQHVTDGGSIAGSFDRNWDSAANYCCVPGVAQMSVVWLSIFRRTGEACFRDAALRANRFLKSLQDCSTSNLRIRGAIKGSHPIFGRYLFGTYPNWGAKFFMDALLQEEALSNESIPLVEG